MTKQTNSQSQKRFQESLGPLFSSTDPMTQKSCLFLKSSSDIGVMRNGGRNGARFAPQSFMATYKKFAQTQSLKAHFFIECEVSNPSEEEKDFHQAQINESQRILSLINEYPGTRLCHLGGGHDHIYPLLKAYSEKFGKIVVINIDAHADTRTDESFHSGTPFRQFAEEFTGDFFLYQIGLQEFANTTSTLTPFSRGESQILWRNEVSPESISNFFKKINQNVQNDTLVVFSLDADALTGHEVPGVSAVNPDGLTRVQLSHIWQNYLGLPLGHAPVMGIYELNPLYDTLAGISMRTLGSFVFESFDLK